MGGPAELKGPDLGKDGIAATELLEGAMLEGHASGEAVLLVRQGAEVFAVAAQCTHYSGPLVEGVLSSGVVRCPWHHAAFDLHTGEATAPALAPLGCWKVEQRDGRIFVADKRETQARKRPSLTTPRSVVVIGAGAAGAWAVETLREDGYDGALSLVGNEDALPVDRPNLSKDYLAGTAPEEWMPLRSSDFYAAQEIELHLGVAATGLDLKAREVALANGKSLAYDTLLLATGAEPVRLPIPGADLAHVYLLRSLAESRAIIARAASAKRVVVLGASFLGLEVAASLRARGLEVAVVAPEKQPLARVLGSAVGAFLRALHESRGVHFHLGRKPAVITAQAVTLDDGTRIPCDLCVMGVGVRPATALAEAAGIVVDNGILTDEYLETSVPGVFAAGDVARYLTVHGTRQRAEHWVHAGRQGQVAAQNILGRRRPFAHVPFFWSVHYDVTICYVGDGERWDTIQIVGSLEGRDATIAYRNAGVIDAVATIGRDRVSLLAEGALERGDLQALEALLEAR